MDQGRRESESRRRKVTASAAKRHRIRVHGDERRIRGGNPIRDIIFSSIGENTDLIRTGRLSPVELMEATLDEIDQQESRLNAFISVFRDESLELARQAEIDIRTGKNPGSLHGIPIALKDLIDVAGRRTTCGSKFYEAGSTARSDSTITRRLKQAGAIIVGKTNLHEFAFGVTTENPHFGSTANPWDTSRVPGGSSGGSGAAVSAGLCAGALGTDTGGSVRIPSALCGIAGLKPTYGRISVLGVTELARSLDCAGPMCRRVGDIAIMMNVLAGSDPDDALCSTEPAPDYTDGLEHPVDGLKAGIPNQHFYSDLDSEVDRAVREAIKTVEALGAEIVEIDLPSVHEVYEVVLTLLMAEASYYHEPYLTAHRDDYGRDVQEILAAGQNFNARDYIHAERVRENASRTFSRAFEEVDVLLTPAVPVPAPQRTLDDPSVESESNKIRPRMTQNTRIFNLLGLPALSVPCGFTGQGLPVGLQIAGPWWSEKTLLQVGHAYERATPWHTMRPE